MTSCKKTQKDVTGQQCIGEQSRLSTSPDGKVLKAVPIVGVAGITLTQQLMDSHLKTLPWQLLHHLSLEAFT
jgi:hypothetical protein